MRYYSDDQIEYGKDKITTDIGVLDIDIVSITDTCCMKFSAGTTGFKGGDSGHGSRTTICIQDIGGSDIRIKDKTDMTNFSNGSVAIAVGGDAELRLLIDGLRWMADTLENKANIEKIKKVQKSIGIV